MYFITGKNQLHDSILASLSTQNFCYLLHIPNSKQLNKLMAFFIDEWLGLSCRYMYWIPYPMIYNDFECN